MMKMVKILPVWDSGAISEKPTVLMVISVI
jgi:hypothetical protein